MENKKIQNAIKKLIEVSASSKKIRDSKNQKILEIFKEGFEVMDANGPKKIGANLLQQIIWRLMNKIKMLDFEMHGDQEPEWKEDIMTYGLSTLAIRSEFMNIMKDKQGVWWNSFLFGDGYYMCGTSDNSKMPIVFSVIPNSNIYVDQFATSIRATQGRGATEVLVIFSMKKSYARSIFPELQNRDISGKISRDFGTEIGRNIEQTIINKDEIEIGYYFNIENSKKPYSAVIAGQTGAIIRQFEGAEYPYQLHDSPYIPVFQHSCFAAAEGFYNYGIGDLFYNYATINRSLLNLALGHAEDSVYPISMVNIPMGKTSEFMMAMQAALSGRANGLKPILPIEYDPQSPGSSRLEAQSLITPSAMNEFTVLREIMDQDIRRLGISLDDANMNPNATQYQILAEQEKQGAFISNVQERNSSDFGMTLDVMLNMSETFISKSNKTKIDTPVMINVEGQHIKPPSLTMGMWAEELKSGNWWFKIDSRSGSIPSNVAKQARLQRILPLLQPGSPAQLKTLKEFAALNDRTISMNDLAIAAPPQASPAISPQAGAPAGVVPTSAQPDLGQRLPLEALKT